MSKVFEQSNNVLKQVRDELVRQGALKPDDPDAKDVAREIAAALERQARVPDEKLHRRVTI